MNAMAIAAEVLVSTTLPPPRTTADSTARYTATNRSSKTSVPSIGALSSFAIHPRWMSDFVMMAEEEI